MSFADYIASIYETIIGSTYAKAAGADPAAAIAYVVSRQDAILATAKGAGMITPGMSQAQIDLAVKAAAAGFLMGEAIKADIGLYAGAANNFMLALVQGTAVYNTDLTVTYKPGPGQGVGRAVDVAPKTGLPGGPPPPPEPPPEPLHFTLSAGTNTAIGSDLDDTFAATGATLDASDILNGGAGNDTLTVTVTTSPYTLPNPTVSNLETLVINATGAVSANTTGWTGLTQLTTTTAGETTLKAVTTTNVNATVTALGTQDVIIYGGHDITVNVTGATTGEVLLISSPDKATGAIHSGLISVEGGTSISVTATATNAVNTTQTNGTLNLMGGNLTTTVTAKTPRAATADSTHAGIITGNVIVEDINRSSTTLAGTITSIDIDGADQVLIYGNALTTLKVSHTGSVYITQGAGPAATTLNATLNDVNGEMVEASRYTTMNLTTGAEISALSRMVAPILTTLNIDGVSTLTVSDVSNLTSLQTVTTSGSAGLNADLSGVTTLTTVNTTASTGASTVTIDPSKTAYAGGAGADTVTLSGTSITKAINLGGGNDTLVLANGTGVPGVVLNGGAGTADVLSMLFSDAIAVSGSGAFAAQTTGFERLLIRGGGNTTLDVTQLGNYHYFISQGGVGITLKGLVSGDTLEFKDTGSATKLDAGDFGGANDTLNIVLANPGNTSSYGQLYGDVIENLVISVVDTAEIKGTHQWTARSTSVKTVTVTGNVDLGLVLYSTNVTSIDASGLTGGGLTHTTQALTGAATIKGSANHDNSVTFSAATGGVITYEGGSANDTVYGSNGLSGNIIHLGEGTNYFVGDGGGTSAITAGAGDDYIRMTSGGGTINAGNGHNIVIALDATASTITTGTGADEIFVGGAANVINVGSGTDRVEVSVVDAASDTVFNTITGFGANDILKFDGLNNANIMGAQITGASTLAGYLALANSGAGTSTTNTLRWFVIGSDVYILSDVSDATTFVQGSDSVVKLVGAATLNIAAATVVNGEITFH